MLYGMLNLSASLRGQSRCGELSGLAFRTGECAVGIRTGTYRIIGLHGVQL